MTPATLTPSQAAADQGKAELAGENICRRAGENLRRIRGADAIRIAALLPEELNEEQRK